MGIALLLLGILASFPEFIIIGLLMLLSRLYAVSLINRLKLDVDRKVIKHQRGLFISVLSKKIDPSKLKNIEIRSRIINSSNSSRTIYELVLKGETEYVLQKGQPTLLRSTGKRLAKGLNLNLVNRIYSTKSALEPEELDLPLFKQWKRDGFIPKKPSTQNMGEIKVREINNLKQITIPPQRWSAKIARIMLIAFSAAAIALFPLRGGFLYFYYAFFGFSIVFLSYGLMVVSSSSRITISPNWITYRQGKFIFKHKMFLNQIEEVIKHYKSIVLYDRTDYFEIGVELSTKEHQFLKELIEYEIYSKTSSSPTTISSSHLEMRDITRRHDS